jgi:hypothetical protein
MSHSSVVVLRFADERPTPGARIQTPGTRDLFRPGGRVRALRAARVPWRESPVERDQVALLSLERRFRRSRLRRRRWRCTCQTWLAHRTTAGDGRHWGSGPVRDGTSPEIGARLFLSARTVQYHLKRSSSNSASNRAPSSTGSHPINHRSDQADWPVARLPSCRVRSRMWMQPQATDDEDPKDQRPGDHGVSRRSHRRTGSHVTGSLLIFASSAAGRKPKWTSIASRTR